MRHTSCVLPSKAIMTECFRSEVVYYNRGLKMEKHVSHHVGVYINKLCVRFKRDHLLPNKKKKFWLVARKHEVIATKNYGFVPFPSLLTCFENALLRLVLLRRVAFECQVLRRFCDPKMFRSLKSFCL